MTRSTDGEYIPQGPRVSEPTDHRALAAAGSDRQAHGARSASWGDVLASVSDAFCIIAFLALAYLYDSKGETVPMLISIGLMWVVMATSYLRDIRNDLRGRR